MLFEDVCCGQVNRCGVQAVQLASVTDFLCYVIIFQVPYILGPLEACQFIVISWVLLLLPSSSHSAGIRSKLERRS